MPPCGRIESIAATASTTESGSARGANSTIHTPSRNSSTAIAAISKANRVLPTPPVPVSVTNRRRGRSATRRCKSATEPNHSSTGAGRLPTAVRAVLGWRSSHGMPSGHAERVDRVAHTSQLEQSQVHQLDPAQRPQHLGRRGAHQDLAAMGRAHSRAARFSGGPK